MKATVYAWGANSHGQLGLGIESELCMTPERVNHLSFNTSNVKCIRGGGGHVLVLDCNGRLHACGWNNRGQLGLDSYEECHNVFQCIPSEFFEEAPVESIACGWDISGCITVTKSLYVWGSNSFQQLGLCQRGFNAVRKPLAVQLPRADLPRCLSFGLRHCGVLTQDYKLYVFGRLRINEPVPSELNITSTTINKASILKIQMNNPAEHRIVSIVSGQNHILLKIQNVQHTNSQGCRRIVALGDNKFGQCNMFHFENDILQLAAGWTHNAVLLRDQLAYLWGRNCYGQLGNGEFSANSATPLKLQLADNALIARIYLGSEHAIARSENGKVYTWGWNEHGNCGNNSTENICTPCEIKLNGVCKAIGAGAGFCYAICEEKS